MPLKFLFSLSLFLSILCFTTNLYADWINFSGAENSHNIAEIYIEEGGVRMQLEVYVGDLETFEPLIPDDLLTQRTADRPDLKTRERLFANQVLQVIADGKRLPVLFKLVEPRMRIDRPSPFAGKINPYTRQPIPGPPQDRRVLYAELVYPFNEQPQTIRFVPPVDENGMPLASIGFLCNHAGVTVVDYRLMSPESTLHLDWEDPWYSEFDNKALKRKVGTGMRTFLYIEPYEVRKEIIVRPVDLQRWVDLGLEGLETIPPELQPELTRQAAEFLRDHHNVLIDGEGSDIHIVAVVDGERLDAGNGAVLDPTRPLELVAGDEGVECMVLQGRPIGEPVAQYGPFVMNTHAEIQQAFEDYRRTQFGGWPWGSDDPNHGPTARRFANHADGRVEVFDVDPVHAD